MLRCVALVSSYKSHMALTSQKMAFFIVTHENVKSYTLNMVYRSLVHFLIALTDTCFCTQLALLVPNVITFLMESSLHKQIAFSIEQFGLSINALPAADPKVQLFTHLGFWVGHFNSNFTTHFSCHASH
jgi:hypothetical protein